MSQYEDMLATILQKIEEAEAVVVGGASGMSTANGHDFYGPDSKYWLDNFSEFKEKYGLHGISRRSTTDIAPAKNGGLIWPNTVRSCLTPHPDRRTWICMS